MRIAVFGDYIGLTTGYGQNNLSIALGLKERGHEVYNMAVQYNGLPIEVNGIKVYPTGSMYTDLREITHTIHQSMKAIKPDIVLHHGDNWHYTPFSEQGTYHLIDIVHRYGSKLVNYTPLQSYPMPPEVEESFVKDGDYTITMTQWSLEYLKQFTSNSDYLYHGVRADIHPIDIPQRPWNLPDGNMLLSVGNSGDYRKMGPLLLKTFKRYKEMSYDMSAYLFLQMQIRWWYGLDLHIHNLEMQKYKDKVIFSSNSNAGSVYQALSIQDLNTLYNTATAYISLSAAEGFGMTELEAASIGLPTLVTDFPVHRELLSEYPNVHFVKAERTYPQVWGFEWLADTEDAAAKLSALNYSGYHRSKGHVPEKYKWPVICERLEKILEKV